VVDEPIALGTEMILRFAPPLSAIAVSLRCIARWTAPRERGHDLGLSFVAVPDRVRTAIAAYAAIRIE
jgi:hypothetical protein